MHSTVPQGWLPVEICLALPFQVLDLSHMDKLSAGHGQPDATAEIAQALCAAVSAAGEHLRDLNMDAAQVSDDVLLALSQKCIRLESLSLIGCRPLTDVGLEAVAKGCPRLIKLAVGGPSFSWREDKGLAAFKGLKHLTISRRTRCADSSLVKVWHSTHALLPAPDFLNEDS